MFRILLVLLSKLLSWCSAITMKCNVKENILGCHFPSSPFFCNPVNTVCNPVVVMHSQSYSWYKVMLALRCSERQRRIRALVLEGCPVNGWVLRPISDKFSCRRGFLIATSKPSMKGGKEAANCGTLTAMGFSLSTVWNMQVCINATSQSFLIRC